MLTCRGDPVRLASFGPPHAQPGMQAKASLILEDKGFPCAQVLKFFLMPGGSASPLLPGPEDTHNWPVSSDTLAGASISGPVAHSVLGRTGALGVRLASGRPNGPCSAQALEATAPDVVRLLARSAASTELAVPALACSSELSGRRHSRLGSNGSNSCVSVPRLGPSIQAADLRRSKEGRQLSTPAKPRASSWQKPQDYPESPLDVGYRQAPYKQFSIK